ncbi:MAG: AAA family ATPase, partial [Pseudobdellovibrionaceae bacterium]|nr:AAA family ATPase [Pseudobdellovibrionaceae bacterium]
MLQIPGYDIHQKIYDSANSLIYRGIRREDGRPVILKRPKKEIPSADDLARSYHEFELLNSLTIGGVPKVFEFFQQGSDVCLITEDVGGHALSDISALGTLPMPLVIRLFIRYIQILGEIHRLNIIHRDINPSNLVWNQEQNIASIIDFGIAKKLSHMVSASGSDDGLEGTLHYIAPEQTGRINRTADYRSDYYSLGATLFEMVCGETPFQASDRMELIHAHIARMPLNPHTINPKVPMNLGRVILKMMAKNPEERYQSSAGIRYDFERCAQEIEDGQEHGEFELGTADVSERLTFPAQLFGRSKEFHRLLELFIDASKGNRRAVFIKGPAGIGKSRLVQELIPHMASHHCQLIKGEFTQRQSNIPYSGLVQPLRTFIERILCGSEKQIDFWRGRIVDVLGPNGKLLTGLMPELLDLLGEQTQVPQLSPDEEQNRFRIVFTKFFACLSTPSNPIVLHLEHLNCADEASVKILTAVLKNHEQKNLFVVGSIKDDEPSDQGPAENLLKLCKELPDVIEVIELAPWSMDTVNELLSKSLRTD